jgi:3-methyl-2-oxobutanoate hydroxymethyltransferase
MLLLECVPARLAEEIMAIVEIPVIGIGAGAQCDAQILVLQDILGITPGKPPKFSRNFMQGGVTIQQAIANYVRAVKDGSFPASEHIFE